MYVTRVTSAIALACRSTIGRAGLHCFVSRDNAIRAVYFDELMRCAGVTRKDCERNARNARFGWKLREMGSI